MRAAKAREAEGDAAASPTHGSMLVARRSAFGALWLTVSTGVQGGVGLTSSIILARTLGPAPYGQYATATAIVDIAGLMTAWGFSVVLVQQPSCVDVVHSRLYQTALTLGLLLGAAFVALMLLGSILAAGLLPAGVAWLLPLLSLRVAMLLMSSCLFGVLQRQLQFGLLAVSAAISSLLCEALAVAVALLGGGVWALLVRDLTNAVATLVVLALFGGALARPGWERASAVHLLGKGGAVLVTRALQTVQSRIDRLAIGLTAGSAVTGLYAEAGNLAGDNERAMGPVLGQVALGTYARLRDDPVGLGAAFKLVQMTVLRFGGIVTVVLLAAPRAVLELLYGERWLAAAPILRLFAVLALGFPIYEHLRSTLYACGEIGIVARVRGVQLAAFVPALALGLHFAGVQGVAVAADLAVAIGIVGLLPSVWRILGTPTRAAVVDVAPVLLAGLVGVIAVMSVGGRYGLLVTIAVPGLAYGAVLVLLQPRALIRDTITVWRIARPRPSGDGEVSR